MAENRYHALLDSEARTSTATADFHSQGRGLVICVDVTARANATTLTPKLSLRLNAPSSATVFDVWTGAAINTSDATYAYAFYPGIDGTNASYTQIVNAPVAGDLRLTMTPSDGSSVTYSVEAWELV